MYDLLKEKKLLILGASSAEISLVERAKSFGVYVIVTDNNTNWKKSPAKYFADEAWDVSWSDIDCLEKLCKEHNVDGITAGYSEFRVENLIKLTQKLDLPCYLNMEQLDITRDKEKFKQMCKKYDIPVVNEYKNLDEVINFPVIVKPVDRGGSIGISIANNITELKKAYEYAMNMSVTKNVVIEDFICDATKVDFYYSIENEDIRLLSSCDTINGKNNKFDKVIQSAWFYPEREHEKYFNDIDLKIRNMIRGMKIKYGCIFYSGFIFPNGEYLFFECGFRLEGAHQYGYVDRKGIFNFLDLFIIHALTGSTELLSRDLEENKNLKSVVINLYAKKGTIGVIKGIEEIAKLDNCSFTMLSVNVGDICEDDSAILTKIGMFSFCSESSIQLKKDVDEAYKLFEILDTKGDSMLYDKIDTSIIQNWWNN